MSSDGYGSDHGTTSIPHDAPSPSLPTHISPYPPRLVQLRSRIIPYTDTNNPNPSQPTPSSFLDDLTDPFNPINPFPPAGINPSRPSNAIDSSSLIPDDDSTENHSPTSSLLTASSSPSIDENLTPFERHFLGLHAARQAFPISRNGQPSLTYENDPPKESFMLSESELRGLDAEIYGHLDPEEHGLTFSRRELRQLFDEAEARWRTRTPSPVEPSPEASSSPNFPWEGTHRREECQRIFDAWEEFRNRMLPSPGMFQGFLDRIVWEEYAPDDFDEPMEEARHAEALRTSRRRIFDEVGPESEDEAEARGRSRRRIDRLRQ